MLTWGFPKIRGTFLGVPIIRAIVFWGLYRGPLVLGNYHIRLSSVHLRLGSVGLIRVCCNGCTPSVDFFMV